MGKKPQQIDVILKALRQLSSYSYFVRKAAKKDWDDVLQAFGTNKHIAKYIIRNSKIKHEDQDVWLTLQNHEDEFVVAWAISETPNSHSMQNRCPEFLGHLCWEVRKSASEWLINVKIKPQILIEIIKDDSSTRLKKSWSAYTYMQRLIQTDKSLKNLKSLKELNENIFTKKWNFECDKKIREAIVKRFAPHSVSGTDIRYILEANLASNSDEVSSFLPPHRTISEVSLALAEVLENNGIKVSKTQHVVGGEYWVIGLEKIEEYKTNLYVSGLGGFVARDIIWFKNITSYREIDENLSSQSKNRIKLCEQIITESGFIWLNEDLLQNTVPQLNNSRLKNKSVADFLFDWDS